MSHREFGGWLAGFTSGGIFMWLLLLGLGAFR